MSFVRIFLLAALTTALSWTAAAAAETQDDGWRKLVGPAPLTDETARERGWVSKDFDFGPKAISFRTYLPADARVETAPAQAEIEQGHVARFTTVGKVTLARDGAAIETTVTTIRLKSPAVASRICDWGFVGQGYDVDASFVALDLSEAEMLGYRAENGRRTGGGYLTCFTRGDWMMTLFIQFDLRSAADKGAVKSFVDATRAFVDGFVSNIRFADGAASGFGDRGTNVEALLGESRLDIEIPDLWKVRINDFRGSLPAELHLTQEADGKSRGAIWFAAQERKEPPDLESLGPDLVKDYFRAQTPDADAFAVLVNAEDPTFKAAGVPSRSFRLSVKNKAGADSGDIMAAVYWKDGRLYVMSFWSHWSPSAEDGAFFSRLSGLSAYDRIRMALLSALSDPKTP